MGRDDRRKSKKADNVNTINVMCRFRPSINNNDISKFLQIESNSVNFQPEYSEKKMFSFDKIFHPSCQQLDIFNEVENVVSSVMSGFNGTILAYGQTNAGKSWTMEGLMDDVEFRGIIPRSIDAIFEAIYDSSENLQFQLKLSYYEIYCEKVRDLLNPSQDNMKLREVQGSGFIIQDLTEVYCNDRDSVIQAIQLGKANRASAPTLMNAESSRSHSIVSIVLKQKDDSTGRSRTGRLFLVDLAGSEKVSKTGASGMRLEEAKNINSSLTTLGMVINALCDNAPHIPYRDSKLTKLLMDSLGGNSRTTMIICCSMDSAHIPETLSTLRFGERAKRIENHAKVNEELSTTELQALLVLYKKEILLLKKKIASCVCGNMINNIVEESTLYNNNYQTKDIQQHQPPPQQQVVNDNLSVEKFNMENTSNVNVSDIDINQSSTTTADVENSNGNNDNDNDSNNDNNILCTPTPSAVSPTSSPHRSRLVLTDCEEIETESCPNTTSPTAVTGVIAAFSPTITSPATDTVTSGFRRSTLVLDVDMISPSGSSKHSDIALFSSSGGSYLNDILTPTSATTTTPTPISSTNHIKEDVLMCITIPPHPPTTSLSSSSAAVSLNNLYISDEDDEHIVNAYQQQLREQEKASSADSNSSSRSGDILFNSLLPSLVSLSNDMMQTSTKSTTDAESSNNYHHQHNLLLLKSKISSLESELESERLKAQDAADVSKSIVAESKALRATIVELEAKLLQLKLEIIHSPKSTSRSVSSQDGHSPRFNFPDHALTGSVNDYQDVIISPPNTLEIAPFSPAGVNPIAESPQNIPSLTIHGHHHNKINNIDNASSSVNNNNNSNNNSNSGSPVSTVSAPAWLQSNIVVSVSPTSSQYTSSLPTSPIATTGTTVAVSSGSDSSAVEVNVSKSSLDHNIDENRFYSHPPITIITGRKDDTNEVSLSNVEIIKNNNSNSSARSNRVSFSDVIDKKTGSVKHDKNNHNAEQQTESHQHKISDDSTAVIGFNSDEVWDGSDLVAYAQSQEIRQLISQELDLIDGPLFRSRKHVNGEHVDEDNKISIEGVANYAERNTKLREEYEVYIQRLMVKLVQEQQNRARVEEKLEDVTKQLWRSSESSLANTSQYDDKLKKNKSRRRSSSQRFSLLAYLGFTSFSNKPNEDKSPTHNNSFSEGRDSYQSEDIEGKPLTPRALQLSRSLDLSNSKIAQLHAELETCKEANSIVLETKDAMMRSLVKQNTLLVNEAEILSDKNIQLEQKVQQLQLLLRVAVTDQTLSSSSSKSQRPVSMYNKKNNYHNHNISSSISSRSSKFMDNSNHNIIRKETSSSSTSSNNTDSHSHSISSPRHKLTTHEVSQSIQEGTDNVNDNI